MKRKSQTIFCPYCGKPAILRKASDIYKTHTLEEYLYACSDYPACDAYVGVHRGTLLPKGSLANKELRRKRIVAHRYFDSIWKHGILNRKMHISGFRISSDSPVIRHISVSSLIICAIRLSLQVSGFWK